MFYFLYKFFYNEENIFGILRIFKSITIRSLMAFLVAFFIVVLLGKPFIRFLRNKKISDEIREVGPATHYQKKGTPTMGGVLIITGVITSTLINGNLLNKFVLVLLLVTLLFSIIGFLDDYLKWTEKDKKGLSGKKKIIGQAIVSLVLWFIMYKFNLIDSKIEFSLINPFVKNSYLYLGAFLYLPFLFFLITGTSNAVNITDGLDGLAIFPVMVVCLVLGIVAYFTGHIELSTYLNLYYINGSGEILVFLSAIIGAGLGFLWYNFYPAQIFMGDTGSLSLGGIIGTASILLKQELLLPIIGFVFVVETVSVIIQVSSYKTRKKRVFKMAPIHHHFELQGLPETKVTIRFWIMALMFGIIGLIILKIR